MTTIHFTKYQGTGNDFILIDNLNSQVGQLTQEQVKFLCDRKYGVGADGLILIEPSKNADFYMNYYNSDGSQSFCGNGSRCSVHFAYSLGKISNETSFDAIDGMHKAKISNDLISIEMKSVPSIVKQNDDFILSTGSPHFVRISDDISTQLIVKVGKMVRFSNDFLKEGINVNLMRIINQDSIEIATYERGIENETLSCGTGATACAIVLNEIDSNIGKRDVLVKVKGGNLRVSYVSSPSGYDSIELSGPAIPVFNGRIEI